MLKNPRNIPLYPGMYYMLESRTGERLDPPEVLQYTADTEDAYHVSGMFGPECNEIVIAAMGVIEYDTRT